MKKVTGKVEAVSTKPLAQEDKYGNTHRASIKLDDGNWYSMGSLKSNVLTVQDDNKKWQPLGIGSEVLIKYEENGDFRNSSRGQMTILDLVVGERESSSKPAPTSKTTTVSAGTNWAEKDAGIQAGHAVNGAIQVLKEKLAAEGWNSDLVLQYAKHVHDVTRRLQREIMFPTVTKDTPETPPPGKKPAAKGKKEPAEIPADWEDEEIPF